MENKPRNCIKKGRKKGTRKKRNGPREQKQGNKCIETEQRNKNIEISGLEQEINEEIHQERKKRKGQKYRDGKKKEQRSRWADYTIITCRTGKRAKTIRINRAGRIGTGTKGNMSLIMDWEIRTEERGAYLETRSSAWTDQDG